MMQVKAALCIAAAMFFFTTRGVSAQAPTEDEIKVARSLLLEFGSIESRLKSFTVVSDALITVDTPFADTVTEKKYVWVCDGEKKKRRFDALTAKLSDSQGQDEYCDTLLQDMEGVKWFGNGVSAGGWKVGEELNEQINPLPELVLFRPFVGAVYGYSSLARKRVGLPRLENFNKVLSEGKVTAFEEDIRFYGFEVLYDVKEDVAFQLVFDKELRVPVESKIVTGKQKLPLRAYPETLV